MDDDYDMDEFNDEADGESEYFDEDIDGDDDLDASDDAGGGRDLMELEELGVMDGQQDAVSSSFYTGFGVSVDFDELSDEEREAYEMGYYTGYGAGGGC